jgi:hypothetical protein
VTILAAIVEDGLEAVSVACELAGYFATCSAWTTERYLLDQLRASKNSLQPGSQKKRDKRRDTLAVCSVGLPKLLLHPTFFQPEFAA